MSDYIYFCFQQKIFILKVINYIYKLASQLTLTIINDVKIGQPYFNCQYFKVCGKKLLHKKKSSFYPK